MAKCRYKVDLQAYMAECEANYTRMRKLLPDDSDQIRYHFLLPNDETGELNMQVVERCPYTTMVKMRQNTGSTWLDQEFHLRLYHDVKMVEVMPKSGTSQLRGRYEYPNKGMSQEDEKFQQHRFLSECLAYCLSHGLSTQTVELVR